MPRGFYKGMLVALIATLSAIAGVLGMSRSNVEEADNFQHRTGTIHFELSATEGMSVARLRVHVQVDEGGVCWKLTDPQGQVRLNGHGDRGDISTDSGEMEPLPGTWLLEMQMEGASGHYRVDWDAS